MSTTDDIDSPSTLAHTVESLRYAITHVFFPSISPSCDDDTLVNNHSLARAVCVAARAYSTHVCNPSEQAQWRRIAKMLDNFQASFQTEHTDHHLVSQLREMQSGDILAYFMRPKNAGVVLTKQEGYTRCEAFEVSPSGDAVKETPEFPTCSYPGSTIELSSDTIDDDDFRLGLAAFLSPANNVTFDLPSPSDPQYVHVLHDILQRTCCGTDDSRKPSILQSTLSRGIRRPAVVRVVKRVRKLNKDSWLRSPLWLFIRVIIQMSDVPSLQISSFKSFVLFFMCTLGVDENNPHLPSDTLRIISSTIVRRFGKLGSSTPDWLSEMALKACTSLREILDARQKQLGARQSPFRNPSQDELVRDTQVLLLDSRDYIRDLLESQGPEPVRAPFHPNHLRRGAIEDFLSSDGAFFDEAYAADPEVTIYDVEQSVEEGIDDWLACVDNVDEACTQLEILMDKYVVNIWRHRSQPEHQSISVLTVLELFVVLDKLVMRKIPMLADYSPVVPVTLLEKLLLRTATSLHRLSCAYQYLSARHSQSHLGSVLSDNFTEDSFPARYYDQSADLQRLKARIEEDSNIAIAEVSQPRLPASPLYAKVFVFELQCPLCIRIWRSAVSRIWYCIGGVRPVFHVWPAVEPGYNVLARAPAFQPYFIEKPESQLRVQIHFAYHDALSSQSPNGPTLHYVVEWPEFYTPGQAASSRLSVWESGPDGNFNDVHYQRPSYGSPLGKFVKYVDDTVHSPNDVLSAQTDCPTSLSLHEFISFARLRSGGTLQWLNLLQGLHNRSIRFRYNPADRTYFLLRNMAFQVGPLDLNTGSWIWHRELEDSSFCNTLLDELENLFMDVSAGSMDSAPMNLIALLLTRLLAPSAGEDILDRVVALLQRVRSKTFSWAQDILYDLAMAPGDKDHWRIFHDMAGACRSTFHVECGTLCKLLKSPEDVDALLSCAFFMHAFRSRLNPNHVSEPIWMRDRYSDLLRERDQCFTPALEEILADVILADPTDYGIDLAAAKILASYHPGVQRWERLQHPNGRWLIGAHHNEIEAITNHSSRTVHINLLNGEIRVAGRPLHGLPDNFGDSRVVEEILCDQSLFILPSDLPGMDFKTKPTFKSSNRQIHFSVQEKIFKLQVQYDENTRAGSDILALIPSSKLRHDLPPALVDGHVHWLNLSKKFIEIRPLAHIWEESCDHWRIDCTSEQYHMDRAHERLVDVHSPTWKMVHKSFQCINVNAKANKESPVNPGNVALLDGSGNLMVTTRTSSNSASWLYLAVTLPRFGLSFFVNEQEEFESHEFKDMVYDEDQSVGALFGLESLLVLRPKTHIAGTIIPVALVPRCVLLPNGEPYTLELENHNDRNYISIDPTTIISHSWPRAACHMYNMDTELGCFIGNGSMESKRFLAHLHAMTNGWHHPDPLTGKTGVQTALCFLHSAACRSIMEGKQLIESQYMTHPEDTNVETIIRWPQIRDAHTEVQERYYWDRDVYEKAKETHEAREFTGECLHNHTITCLPPLFTKPSLFPSFPQCFTLQQLFASRPAPELPQRTTLLRKRYVALVDDIHMGLDQLLSSLHAGYLYQHEYLAHLGTSEQHARLESRTTYSVAREDSIEALKEHFVQCRASYLSSLDTLKKSLGPSSDSYQQAVAQSCGWPAITADVLLRYLTSAVLADIPPPWQTCLTSLALLLLDLQRARRLLRFALDGRKEEFQKELENEGCDGWNSQEHPDWLLIQIEGNFLIRRSQAEAAMEVMSPHSGDNTIIQINMGEGKSSVIVPIAAAALADGKQLVRVVVPKSLTTQMFELLVARLGGLANRPIYYLPFSRSPEYDANGQVKSLQIDDLHKLMRQCMAERGILLVQPEHVVSLKLMNVDQQLRQLEGKVATQPSLSKLSKDHDLSHQSLLKSNRLSRQLQWLSRMLTASHSLSKTGVPRVASSKLGDIEGHHSSSRDVDDSPLKWVNLQKWIHANVRDILDESDEILHSRLQLVYTLGSPQPLDGYPDRWTIIQQVLRLVRYHLHSLSTYSPDSVLHECSFPGSFPHVHIIRSPEISRRLISLITEDVMSGRLPTFNFRHLSSGLQTAIRSFISDEDVLQIPHTAKRVEEYAKSSDQRNLWSGLLLLRGLLTSNILLFSLLEKRWRVDYGPCTRHPLSWQTTPAALAVPYRAKDVSAHDTQFGHPDLTIVLTCLSYYYGGLDKGQLQIAFEMLFNQNDPHVEYALWVSELESVPDSLRELKKLNLRSWVQWENTIFPYFTRNQATVDFYLSQVVFPKETKEFPSKLSCSSWDLAGEGGKLVTGFSGTTDGRWLLPTSIKLAYQMGTDARALARILRPEDNSYLPAHENDEKWDTRVFLRFMAKQEPGIRVLIDVGSQILDLTNYGLAREWLRIASDAIGAVYFEWNDELTVLTSDGTTSPLSSSVLSQQLGRCVVYLDHAHTRGTDLKLPIGSRAAVTLGPRVTKDALVQGCMRMRKLGNGHSVVFFAPPKVDWSIRAVTGKTDPSIPLTTVDVLCWAIHETWNDIHQRAPHWAQQGMSHKRRQDAWSRFLEGQCTRQQLSDAWLQTERKSLVDLYAPRKTTKDMSGLDPEIQQRCKEIGVLSLPSMELEEEQEREVHREREREREVELPPKAEPAEHVLHQDVVSFVKTGLIPPRQPGGAFIPIFTTLEGSSATTRDSDVWSPSVLATADFFRTVKPESTRGTMDQYLRPVQWILSNKNDHGRVLVLLSPFEVDRLMRDIRTSDHVHLHLYSPRTTLRMKPADDLKLYTIPPLPSDWTPPWTLIDQLNVFAGQLYLRDYESYLRLCRFLDVPTKDSPRGAPIPRNSFNIPGGFEKTEIMFSDSPLPFVMALLAVRTRGQPFAHTHMGRIIQGQILTEKDFEGPAWPLSDSDDGPGPELDSAPPAPSSDSNVHQTTLPSGTSEVRLAQSG